MRVWVNKKEHDLNTEKSLRDLIQQLELKTLQGIAVALNNKVIPKGNWSSTNLKDLDKVTIITATQGG